MVIGIIRSLILPIKTHMITESHSYKVLVSGIGPGYGGWEIHGIFVESISNNSSVFSKRLHKSAVYSPIIKILRLLLFRIRLRSLYGEDIVYWLITILTRELWIN